MENIEGFHKQDTMLHVAGLNRTKNTLLSKTMPLSTLNPYLISIIFLAEEDWHMPIESSQYFIILFRVNQVFTFYHFIIFLLFTTFTHLDPWLN